MPTRATDSTSGDGAHLRLLCPQWQGAGTSSVRDLASEFPLDVARRGYAVGNGNPRRGLAAP
jgi:arginase